MVTRTTRTAICAIAKDEDKYILEWAAYHLAIGFDHIFIYDNMSVNKIERLFNRRALAEKISVFLWPSYPDRNAQTEAYSHFINSYGTGFDWVAILDIDEMINIKQDHSIQQFLSRFAGADSVAINWRVFGSSGETNYRPSLVMERFTRASSIEFEPNGLIKSILKTERVIVPHVHHAKSLSENSKVVTTDGTEIENTDFVLPRQANYDVAQINHYFSKSYEEWIWKINRGYTDGTVRDPKLFANFDRNEWEDISILRFHRATRRYIKLIGARNKFWLNDLINRNFAM